MPEYQQAVGRYLAFLAAACLISMPFIGPGAIVIWLLTAITLKTVFPGNEIPPTQDRPGRCGHGRKRRR